HPWLRSVNCNSINALPVEAAVRSHLYSTVSRCPRLRPLHTRSMPMRCLAASTRLTMNQRLKTLSRYVSACWPCRYCVSNLYTASSPSDPAAPVAAATRYVLHILVQRLALAVALRAHLAVSGAHSHHPSAMISAIPMAARMHVATSMSGIVSNLGSDERELGVAGSFADVTRRDDDEQRVSILGGLLYFS